ncbi:MAG: putative toxin-antitoxin system toxin component, PIN family [Chloroflexota bacterium]
MEPLRVVIDTNLLVSYLLTAGDTISQIVTHWEEDRIVPVVSPHIMAELTDVLERPKLRQYMKGDPDTLVQSLLDDAIMTPGLLDVEGASRDPKDDKFLACAVEGQAAYLVTGDYDLLDLHEFGQTRIVRPFELLGILNQE